MSKVLVTMYKIEVFAVKQADIQADLSPMLLALLSFDDEAFATSASRGKWKYCGLPFDLHAHMIQLLPGEIQVDK